MLTITESVPLGNTTVHVNITLVPIGLIGLDGVLSTLTDVGGGTGKINRKRISLETWKYYIKKCIYIMTNKIAVQISRKIITNFVKRSPCDFCRKMSELRCYSCSVQHQRV